MEIKVLIDFDSDPTIRFSKAKQVVYMSGVYTPIDRSNIIGKYITGVEVDSDTGCLILILDEELPIEEKIKDE